MRQNFNQGELVNVDLGKPPNEIRGHEQANSQYGAPRPCLIIQQFNVHELVVIVPITTKKPKTRIYTVVTLLQGTGGLTYDSYVLCHHIRTISFERIIKKLGTLDMTAFLKVQVVLRDILDLSF